MNNQVLTVLVSKNESEEALAGTLDSLQRQAEGFSEKIKIVVLEGGPSVWENRQKALSVVDTAYVMMIDAGDTFLATALERGCACLDEHEDTDAAMLRASYSSRKKMPGDKKAPCRLYDLEDKKNLLDMPELHKGVIIRSSVACETRLDTAYGYETWEAYLCAILTRRLRFYFVQDGVILLHHAPKMNDYYNKDNLKSDWYMSFVCDYLPLTVKSYMQEDGSLPLFIQYQMVYQMKIRFEANRNHKDKHVLKGQELQTFLDGCADALQHVSDDCLYPHELPAQRNVRIPYGMTYRFLALKYKGAVDRNLYDIDPIVYLDLLNGEKKRLVLEFSTADFGWDSIVCMINGKEYPIEETARYAAEDYFDLNQYRSYTFRVLLPFNKIRMANKIEICREYTHNGKTEKQTLKLSTKRYTSRITPVVPYSYWTYKHFMVRFPEGDNKKCILVNRSGIIRHGIQEFRLLYDLYRRKGRMRENMKLRLVYWKSFPKYHFKNIWLTFDKNYKGGDNGEYLYKYLCTRKDSNVVPYYLINADASDRKRLEKEGYQPLIYGSEEHRKVFLHAKMIMATHAGIYNFNHISEEELPYLQDLMRAEAVCIQHGLSVQDLAFNANRAFNNNKLYYCASKYEVENLLQPQYGYEDPSAIRLTGVARYDGLINHDQKQILITPTWRNYLTIPQTEKNQAFPYYEGFKHTEYFKIYNNLISDKRLVETAAKTGYRLIYLIHPNIASQTCDYDLREGVEIISALDVNYEKILTESSLMVTDYSGVQFDFAYMRKPIVYYHTPKLPPHYVEGGFFYETQGFGEICTEHEELVDLLCSYMENGCELKEFYRSRENDFFAFDDHENCKRIFEDAYAWQKRR